MFVCVYICVREDFAHLLVLVSFPARMQLIIKLNWLRANITEYLWMDGVCW